MAWSALAGWANSVNHLPVVGMNERAQAFYVDDLEEFEAEVEADGARRVEARVGLAEARNRCLLLGPRSMEKYTERTFEEATRVLDSQATSWEVLFVERDAAAHVVHAMVEAGRRQLRAVR